MRSTVKPQALSVAASSVAAARLSRESGGRAYFPEDVSELAAQYGKVLEDLRRRYVLGYTSTNSKLDGTFRAIKVRSKRPGVEIRARRGYRAATEAEVAARPYRKKEKRALHWQETGLGMLHRYLRTV